MVSNATPRLHLVDVAQDVVAVAQQLGELRAVETALTGLDLRDPLRVAPVRGLGDLADLDELAGQRGDDAEDLGETPVVGDEEVRAARPGVAFALVIVAQVDRDALRLALDDQLGRLAVRLVGHGRPHRDVGARAGGAMLRLELLPHLRELVAELDVEVADELLTDRLLRLADDVPPLVPERQPDEVALCVKTDGGMGRGRLRRRFDGHGAHLSARFPSCNDAHGL